MSLKSCRVGRDVLNGTTVMFTVDELVWVRLVPSAAVFITLEGV